MSAERALQPLLLHKLGVIQRPHNNVEEQTDMPVREPSHKSFLLDP